MLLPSSVRQSGSCAEPQSWSSQSTPTLVSNRFFVLYPSRTISSEQTSFFQPSFIAMMRLSRLALDEFLFCLDTKVSMILSSWEFAHNGRRSCNEKAKA